MRPVFPSVRCVDVNRCSLRTEKRFLGHICLKSGGLNEIHFLYHKHLRAFNILKIWYKSPRRELPQWLSSKDSACQCRKCKFDPWVGKMPWRRAWQPTPVFLPGESHGLRSPTGYSPQGVKELDITEHTHRLQEGILVLRASCLFFFFNSGFFIPEHSIDLCSMGKPFTKTGLDYFTNIILLKEFSATDQNFLSHSLRGEGTLAEKNVSGTSPGGKCIFLYGRQL